MEAQKTLYLAGDVFNIRALLGNAVFAEAIEKASEGLYRGVLPQLCEPREARAYSIRNYDIRTLLSADAVLFSFDGSELDCGMVVEFIIAKLADIPAVILRTDFRNAGDNSENPWNLMLVSYPRCEYLRSHCNNEYRARITKESSGTDAERSVGAMNAYLHSLAQEVVAALKRVTQLPPIMPERLQKSVYEWMRLFPGAGFDEEFTSAMVEEIIKRRFGKK